MRKCGRCQILNTDTNHFCTHCGNPFTCECMVCYRETSRYTRCGHALCCVCNSRLRKRVCPMCAASLQTILSAPIRDVSELTTLISDIRRFNCDLIRTLEHRCCIRRFTSHVQYDAKFLIRPILSLSNWTKKARLVLPMWDQCAALANLDVEFVAANSERLSDIDLHDKDDAFFIMVHLREYYTSPGD